MDAQEVFSYGDWTVYDNGGKEEVGRVVEDCGDFVRVCYHTGCTSASTPRDMLRKAKSHEIEDYADIGIGYHRFDDDCPDYNPEYCFGACARRFCKGAE